MSLILLAASAGAVLILEPLVIRYLSRRGTVDIPGARTSHSVATPRGGGAALILVAILASVTPFFDDPRNRLLVFIAVGFGVLGLVEDLHGLRVNTRLVVQSLLGMSAGLVLASGSDEIWFKALILVLSAGWTVFVVNVVNFMDGINGISAMQALIAGISYAVFGLMGHYDVRTWPIGLLLGGLAIGFAPFNVPVARVFLGDSGSYLLGGLMGILAFDILLATGRAELAVAPMLLYLTDTVTTLLRRWHTHARLSDAHRDHAYQRLVSDAGWTHLMVAALVGVIVVIDTLLGVLATTSGVLVDLVILAAALALQLAYVLAPGALVRRRGE